VRFKHVIEAVILVDHGLGWSWCWAPWHHGTIAPWHCGCWSAAWCAWSLADGFVSSSVGIRGRAHHGQWKT